MNTTTSAVLTAVVSTAGHWAQGKKVERRVIIGMAVLAIGLAALGEVNAELAQQFGVLVLVAAIMYYMVPIAKGLGYRK